METATIVIIVISLLVILPTFIALGSALFKLYRDIIFAFDRQSDGGEEVTKAEIEGLRADINVIAKLFSSLSERLASLWNKIF